MPAGPCRHCGSVINLANYICPCCSCSYPFIDPSNLDQSEEVTRSVRMLWQEVPTNNFGFGHPQKIPPSNRQLQVKYLTKMEKRLHQRKSIRTFNGGHPWSGCEWYHDQRRLVYTQYSFIGEDDRAGLYRFSKVPQARLRLLRLQPLQYRGLV